MSPPEEHRTAPGPKVAVMTSNPELLAQVLDVLGRAELASAVIMGPPADERTRIPELCDVILLDLDVDGVFPADLVEAVRSRTGGLLIALSSRDDETAKVEALNAGANDYISIPFGTSEFLARIQAARRVHQQLRPASPPSLLDEHGDPEERALTLGAGRSSSRGSSGGSSRSSPRGRATSSRTRSSCARSGVRWRSGGCTTCGST